MRGQSVISSEVSEKCRFRAYESVLSHKTGKNVITYVIYSGGIKLAVTKMNCGVNDYQVIPIYLSDKDADTVLKRLEEKKQNGELFTEEDFAQLALTPLMSSKKERKDIILESLKLSKAEKSITAEKTMAMLYTLADKFLEGKDLEEIKEAVAMTRIGQMIFDDGVVRGREEGKIEGTIKTYKKFELSREEAIKNIIEEFSLSKEEAEKYMEMYW